MLNIPRKILFFYENICSFNKFALYLQNETCNLTSGAEDFRMEATQKNMINSMFINNYPSKTLKIKLFMKKNCYLFVYMIKNC